MDLEGVAELLELELVLVVVPDLRVVVEACLWEEELPEVEVVLLELLFPRFT